MKTKATGKAKAKFADLVYALDGKLRTLYNPAGRFLPLGHAAVPPAIPRTLPPSKFSPEDQATNPDKPMTRLVKDVLRVGKWRTGLDPRTGKSLLWDVKHTTLMNLARNFRLAYARGVACNLTLSHGRQGIVPTDELLAPIDQVIVEDGTLWIASYVTPEQARFLQNPAMKTSIGVWDGWVDGLGNRYDQAMIHVAVTDHPAVPGQGPFTALSTSQGSIKMQDFDKLLELVNSMLPGELSLPDDTTEENLVERLGLVLMTLNGGSTPETPATPEAPSGTSSESPTPEELSATQGNPGASLALLQEMSASLKTLSNEVASLKRDKLNQAKEAFEQEIKTLCLAGMPAAVGSHWLNLGAKYAYDPSLLATAKQSYKLPARQGKTLANPQAPPMATPEAGVERTDDEVRESMKARGLDPEKHFPRMASRRK